MIKTILLDTFYFPQHITTILEPIKVAPGLNTAENVVPRPAYQTFGNADTL